MKSTNVVMKTVLSISMQFSGANSTLVGIPLTNAFGENRRFSLENMFIQCPFNSAIACGPFY